ncbi:hypothetical protein M408DRAFT_61276 [Serendipita vermifera MAFF 305830]|uniref:CAP-Gly domain-containing protein n=1 Tax=Serendipita vermifera MAFF 305830 TaxID=933852 RepID=A0A0C3BP59_SERVB|nr:hypothetical protein M408DRAFT_61276 [Serendipita vermifera MAFF 305830]
MSVGQRVCFNLNYGTIRYSGGLAGKTGTWLGIEWDDPTRGRGDGSVDGTRYFTCSSPTGASFLRSNAPSLKLGRTFVEALKDKYIEDAHDESVMESILLGSSNGIEVEAVNMNKVRGKFARLDTLKEVGMEGYLISSAGPPGEIQKTSPAIRRLELSRNLLSDWNDVVEIVQQLPVLESLTLHYNILRPLSSVLTGQCRSVTELLLGRTHTTWEQSLLIAPAFPSLKHLELGYNDISYLSTVNLKDGGQKPPSLATLTLDGNQIADWTALAQSLKPILQSLLLSENNLARVTAPTSLDLQLLSITTLVIDGNAVSEWSSIDAISAWLPNLSSLRVTDTPLLTETAKYAKQILIGRVGSLRRVNGTEVTEQTRKDCEIFYLSWIMKNSKPDERVALHPRWHELTQIYGTPAEEKPAADTTRLEGRLIGTQKT